jgi:NAD(P)H-nitrite reductase large subunit
MGLWPTAVAQAEVAAVNAVGGQRLLPPLTAAVILKGVGIDLTWAGRTEPDGDDEVILASGNGHSYGKLLLSGEAKVVGGIVLGRPADAPRLMAVVKHGLDVSDRLAALRAGDWTVLDATAAQSSGGAAPPS